MTQPSYHRYNYCNGLLDLNVHKLVLTDAFYTSSVELKLFVD